jgi:hypothetical protein
VIDPTALVPQPGMMLQCRGCFAMNVVTVVEGRRLHLMAYSPFGGFYSPFPFR